MTEIGATNALVVRGAEQSVLGRLFQIMPTTLVFAACGLGTFVLQAVALRLMTKAEVGLIVVAWGVVSVGSTIAGLGLPDLLARTMSAGHATFIGRSKLWTASTLAALPVSALIAAAGLLVPGIRQLGVSGFLLLVALVASANLLYIEASLRRAMGTVRCRCGRKPGPTSWPRRPIVRSPRTFVVDVRWSRPPSVACGPVRALLRKRGSRPRSIRAGNQKTSSRGSDQIFALSSPFGCHLR